MNSEGLFRADGLYFVFFSGGSSVKKIGILIHDIMTFFTAVDDGVDKGS